MLMKTFLTLLFLQTLLPRVSSSSSSSEESGEQVSGERQHAKGSSHGGHWGYEDQEAWSTDFQHCSGTSQSPIDIDTKKAIYEATLPSIALEGYDLTGGEPLTLLNNGHTLQLSLPKTMRIVKGFDNEFRAAQLHFHWGTVEVPGSEHTTDNTHFPAEIHVVHYNSKYANLSEAASKPDGLAVLGGFIGVGLHENGNYDKILSALTDVSIEESNTEIPGFNVRHLLPSSLDRFYRYNGSLTTPPCFQTVNWTMFNDTITVSRKQLAALEDTLKAGQSHQHLNKNFRAPQLLHGRRVLSSFSVDLGGGPAALPVANSPEIKSSNKHLPSAGLCSCLIEGLSKGDVLAIAFGALFAVTVLLFTVYTYQQRKKYSSNKDQRQDVVYKQTPKEEA
ncbi:carbonic anhydrase 14 [Aplochiton taeniatus]